MAHPKHRTSPVTPKRSLEFAGNLIDLIGRGFSGNTISNQSYRNLDNIAVNRNDNLYVVHPYITDRKVPNLTKIALDNLTKGNIFKDGGSIHIAPSKRGTFTAAATKHGMGVQEFASKVLRNKEDYSPSLVKKANFARNASKWH